MSLLLRISILSGEYTLMKAKSGSSYVEGPCVGPVLPDAVKKQCDLIKTKKPFEYPKGFPHQILTTVHINEKGYKFLSGRQNP
jgi:hypothetical protein